MGDVATLASDDAAYGERLTLAAIEVDFLQPRGVGAYNFVKNFANVFYVSNEGIVNPEQFGEIGRMKATELAVDQSFFNMFEMSAVTPAFSSL